MGNFDIFNKIVLHTPYSNVDKNYGPYTGLTEACQKINPKLRRNGLTVGIIEEGEITEYWWQNGTLDIDLIPKLNNVYNSITGETSSRISGDTKLAEDLADEIYNRLSGDTQLSSIINNKESESIDRDDELRGFITGETYNEKNTFHSDFTVQLMTGTFGKYKHGDIIPASGKTAVEVILDAAIQYIQPSFSSFSSNSVITVEVSTELPNSLTFSFGYNNDFNIKPNSLSVVDVTNGNIAIQNNLSIAQNHLIEIGNIKKLSDGSYHEWKAIAKNTNDENFNSSNYRITWRFKTFHGPSVALLDVSSIRNLPYSPWSNVNNFSITLSEKNYTIAIPNSKSISSVITVNNENITENFILRNDESNVILVDGVTTHTYKIYDFSSATVMNVNANVILT